MSSPYRPDNSYDDMLKAYSNQNTCIPNQNLDKPRHGASVEINERGSSSIFHLDKNGSTSKPVIESFKDGIRVGCTFISSEALDKIHGLHKRFLNKEDSTVHQAGSK